MKVVTICGSMKFAKEMQDVARSLESKNGYCVIQCVYNNNNVKENEQELKNIVDAHWKKIEISDAIFVVNKGGYIGSSTQKEIDFAKSLGKEIMYLENEKEKNMKKLILASNNKHKIKEFKEVLSDYEILSLNDIGYFNDIVEDGETFFDNALIKVKEIHNYLKEKNIEADVVADDSGLCVDYLNGAPGVYSARYAGEHGNEAKNRAKLLKELENVENRNAHFTCCLVYMYADGKYFSVEGRTEGEILTEEVGNNGFGYDCLFYSEDLQKSFGEATSEEKNIVSHRGRAIKNLRMALENYDKIELKLNN